MLPFATFSVGELQAAEGLSGAGVLTVVMQTPHHTLHPNACAEKGGM